MIHKTHTRSSTPPPLVRSSRTPRWLSVLALLGVMLALAPAALAQQTSQPHIWIEGNLDYDHNGWCEGFDEPAWIVSDTPFVILKYQEYLKVTHTDTRIDYEEKEEREEFWHLAPVNEVLKKSLDNPLVISDADVELLIKLHRRDTDYYIARFVDRAGPRELIRKAGFRLGQPQTWDIQFGRSIEASQVLAHPTESPIATGYTLLFTFPKTIDRSSAKWEWLDNHDTVLEWRTIRRYTAWINENKNPLRHRFETYIYMADQVGHHRGKPVPLIDEGISADDRKIRDCP